MRLSYQLDTVRPGVYQQKPYQQLSCQDWRQVVRWGGADVWLLTSASRQSWRQAIFFFFYGGSPFFWKKTRRKKPFPSEISVTRSQRRHSTCPPYTLVTFTVKTDTTDIHTVDSECLKTIHQGIQVVCKTQEACWGDLYRYVHTYIYIYIHICIHKYIYIYSYC